MGCPAGSLLINYHRNVRGGRNSDSSLFPSNKSPNYHIITYYLVRSLRSQHPCFYTIEIKVCGHPYAGLSKFWSGYTFETSL